MKNEIVKHEKEELSPKNEIDLKWFSVLIGHLDLRNTTKEHRVNLAFDALGAIFLIITSVKFALPYSFISFCIIFLGIVGVTIMCTFGSRKGST
jgi:hypothetical protein